MSAEDLQRQFYEMLLQSQYWSPERMLDYQRSQLAQLLHHAKRNVPFYEHRLDAVLQPNGNVNWERWGEIPIMRRSDLLAHKDALRAGALPPGHGPVGMIQSSGSTGHPIEVLVTRLARLGSDASRWRSADWHGLDFSRNLCIRHGTDPDNLPPEGKSGGPWGPPWRPDAMEGRTFSMTRAWSIPDKLDFVFKVSAPYLAVGAPKVAHVLAAEAERRGVRCDISVILINGERAGSDDREICRRVFGAELIEVYSSKEGGHMAHLCQTRKGFHVNSERVLIELVDELDQPVPAGVAGRVIITPFFSTAQPLIRYDQGDLATWGHCDCGCRLPYIASIDGRTNHIFRHPDGRRAHRGFPEEFRQALGCTMWQFAQVGPTEFEVRYVPKNPTIPGDEARVRKAFREWYFEDASVRFLRVPEIPLTAGGKFMEYLYEVPQPPK